MKKKYIIILVVVLLIAIIAVVYGYKEYNRGQKDLSGEKADILISAPDLLKAFTDDEAKANTLYLDKLVAVNGKVKSADKDDLGNYTVQLDASSEMSNISCQMNEKYNSDAAKLRSGDEVIIKGTCTGMLMDVILIRCVIVK